MTFYYKAIGRYLLTQIHHKEEQELCAFVETPSASV